MFKINSITVELGETTILNGVSLNASLGQVLTILGPNGAGKSTLIKALTGYVSLKSGTVLYEDDLVFAKSLKERAQLFSYLPQEVQYEAGYTVEEFIRLADYPWKNTPKMKDHNKRLAQALEICDIEVLSQREIQTLSGGERQRVYMAQVVYQDTPIVLLDEPTTFLDLKHVIQIECVIAKLQMVGKLVLCVTHDLQLAKHLSTHAIALKQGHVIASGNAGDVIKPEIIADVFEVEEEVIRQRFSLSETNHA